MDRFIKPWLPSPPPEITLTNANIIDTTTGAITPRATIHIAGGKIVSIDSTVSPASDALDLKGKYVMPGLIDSHVHLSATPGATSFRELLETDEHTLILRVTHVLRSMLSRGFTTVRDCGGAPIALKAAVSESLIPGPRLLLAGHALTQTGGHGDFRNPHSGPNALTECCACGHSTGLARICDGVDECLKTTRDEFRRGSDFIKIMASGGMLTAGTDVMRTAFSKEEIRAITSVAEAAGSYVTAHAYTSQSIKFAITNGVRGIEHGNFLDRDTANLMKELDVFLTPTLSTYAIGAESPVSSEAEKENMRASLAAGMQALKIADDAGVSICFGTDLLGPPHAFQLKEFGLRAKVLSPLKILQSATVTPAKMMGLAEVVGQVREGFEADLLILESNPLQDIGVMERESELVAVLKGGRFFSSKLEGVDAVSRWS